VIYVDFVNLLGWNINTVKKNVEAILDASKEVGLKVNAEKTYVQVYVDISSPEYKPKT
jgi:hypothetical protein